MHFQKKSEQQRFDYTPAKPIAAPSVKRIGSVSKSGKRIGPQNQQNGDIKLKAIDALMELSRDHSKFLLSVVESHLDNVETCKGSSSAIHKQTMKVINEYSKFHNKAADNILDLAFGGRRKVNTRKPLW